MMGQMRERKKYLDRIIVLGFLFSKGFFNEVENEDKDPTDKFVSVLPRSATFLLR